MNTENKSIVTAFIEEIWNQNRFEHLNKYVSAGFTDHSLPPALPATKEGMQQWIVATGNAFEHTTHIEEMVCEGDKVMLKIRMQLKHIGLWRDIEPAHAEVSVVGFRYYKLANGKISEHWGLIDGNAIENQLKETAKGCKIQQ